MFVDGASNLESGQHQPTGGVQHDVERNVWIGEVDGPQHFLGVVYVRRVDAGGKRAAAMLIGSAKLARIAGHPINRVAELLPWNIGQATKAE